MRLGCLLLILFTLVAVFACQQSEPGTGSSGADAPALPQAPFGGAWTYEREVDPMTDRATTHARIASQNTTAFDFPYSKEARLWVNVRRSPRFGTDVILQMDSGQLLCDISDGCTGTVRFDDAKPITVRLAQPSDGSSDALFVQGASRFIDRMERARRFRIELEFFQAGLRQFEFVAEPLVWPPKAEQLSPSAPEPS